MGFQGNCFISDRESLNSFVSIDFKFAFDAISIFIDAFEVFEEAITVVGLTFSVVFVFETVSL